MSILDVYNTTIEVMMDDKIDVNTRAIKLAELRTEVSKFLSDLEIKNLETEQERAHLLNQVVELNKANSTLLSLVPKQSEQTVEQVKQQERDDELDKITQDYLENL